MGRALGYGGAYDTAKWIGLVSERGLLLARVWIETHASVTLHGLDLEKYTLNGDRMVIA